MQPSLVTDVLAPWPGQVLDIIPLEVNSPKEEPQTRGMEGRFLEAPNQVYYLCRWSLLSETDLHKPSSWRLSVGVQNLLLQDISLAWRVFWAEDNQGPKDSRANFDLPLNCLKNLDRGIQLSLEILSSMGWVWWRKLLEIRLNSVARYLCITQHTFITKHLIFPLNANCLPPLWNSKALPSTFSFVVI